MNYERHSWKSWAQRSHVSPGQAVGEAGHGLPCCCPTARESQPAPRAGCRLTPPHPTLLGPVYRQALLKAGASVHHGSEQRVWPTCEFPRLVLGNTRPRQLTYPSPHILTAAFANPIRKKNKLRSGEGTKLFRCGICFCGHCL